MNHDLEVISRVADYHDHISAPSVPVADDLRRGRRRVRRHRGLVAGGVALGVASVVAVVSLATGADSGDHTDPVGPSTSHSTSGPTRGGLGLTAPLVAPKSLLDMRDFGFHLGPLPRFDPTVRGADSDGQTVTLRWGEVADDVEVNVRYQGAWQPDDPSLWPHPERVTIHGVDGYYWEVPGGVSPDIGGDFEASLAWEYAPDSWAYVSAHSDRMNPGPERLRSALIQVAEAVGPGGEPVRVPVRTAAFPPSLPDVSGLSGVGLGSDGSATLSFGQLRLTVGSDTVPQACGSISDGGVETFTYRGHPGCIAGEGTTDQPAAGTRFNFVEAVALQTGHTVRTFSLVGNGEIPEYPIADLKQALADLTVAPLDDQSTWFDLKTALGGDEAGRSS